MPDDATQVKDTWRGFWRGPARTKAAAGAVAAVIALVLASLKLVGGGDGDASKASATSLGPTTTVTARSGTFDVAHEELPVTVSVFTDVDQDFAQYWTFPEGGTPIEFAGGTEAELRNWATVHGQRALGRTVRLTLRGKDEVPTVINRFRIEAVGRSEAAAAAYLFAFPGCGTIPVRKAEVDLADPQLRLKWSDETGSTDAPTLRVSPDDVEVVEIAARSRAADMQWRIIISYEHRGRSGEFVVDDRGKPFHVAGIGPSAKAYRTAPSSGSVRVVREPSGDGRLLTPC